jgi:hypothetical protein
MPCARVGERSFNLLETPLNRNARGLRGHDVRVVFGLQIAEGDRCRGRLRDTAIVGFLQRLFQRADVFLQRIDRGVLSREFRVEFSLALVEFLLTGLMRSRNTLLGTLEGGVGIKQAALEPFATGFTGAHLDQQCGLAFGRGGGGGSPVVACLICIGHRLVQTLLQQVARATDLGEAVVEPGLLSRELVRERGGIGRPAAVRLP